MSASSSVIPGSSAREHRKEVARHAPHRACTGTARRSSGRSLFRVHVMFAKTCRTASRAATRRHKTCRRLRRWHPAQSAAFARYSPRATTSIGGDGGQRGEQPAAARRSHGFVQRVPRHACPPRSVAAQSAGEARARRPMPTACRSYCSFARNCWAGVAGSSSLKATSTSLYRQS